jgi:hypothetical protein
MTLGFSGQIFEKYSISNFMEILPVEVELSHHERRTDIKKITVVFINFANAPKN